MFWKLCSGAAWRDLPERYGPWETVYSRFRRWTKAGLFAEILKALRLRLAADGNLDYSTWLVDGTSVRATKRRRARKRGRRTRPRLQPGRLRDQAPPRVRRAGDPARRAPERGPAAREPLSGGARGGRRQERAPCPSASRATAPTARRASGTALRAGRRGRDPASQGRTRGAAGPPAFDAEGYRKRNAVERFFGWIKEMSAVATRTEKLEETFLGIVHLAMVRLCLRRAVPSNTA